MFNFSFLFFIFVFGLCVGSFMNVCIYRLPISKSISNPPRSFCPNCNHMIRYYDNIPVFSYILLKGCCRYCKEPISLRYLLVEIMSGLMVVAVVLKYGISFQSFIYFIFIASLIVITFIDLDHRIIPDIITLPGIIIGLGSSFFIPQIGFKTSIIGLLAGGGSLYSVAWGYHLITGKDGMGGGDIKLLAMMGTIVGWKGILFIIFVSSAVGTLTGITLILIQGKNMKFAIPFGPFLSLGAITYIFFGLQIIQWYLNTL